MGIVGGIHGKCNIGATLAQIMAQFAFAMYATHSVSSNETLTRNAGLCKMLVTASWIGLPFTGSSFDGKTVIPNP